jgi:hypothetical protein
MATLKLLPTKIDLSIYQGDSIEISATLRNSDGTAFVFPAGTLIFAGAIKSEAGASAGTLTVAQVGTSNVITIYGSPATTAALVAGTTYKYDVQVATGNSSTGTKRTLVNGVITVEGEVTTS